jgi:ribonuclease P protein component
LENNTLRKQIISKKKEISRVFKFGKRWGCGSIKIIYQKNDFDKDRCAVIVSRKNGNSVKRNRIKRIFREIFRNNKRLRPPFYDLLLKLEPGYQLNSQEVKIAFITWISDLEKD